MKTIYPYSSLTIVINTQCHTSTVVSIHSGHSALNYVFKACFYYTTKLLYKAGLKILCVAPPATHANNTCSWVGRYM